MHSDISVLKFELFLGMYSFNLESDIKGVSELCATLFWVALVGLNTVLLILELLILSDLVII